MNLMRVLLFFVSILGNVLLSYGQRQNTQNYSSREGLTDQIVNAAFQDLDGYIWFATQSGVSIYNGSTFNEFIPEEVLKGIDAVAITQTQDGAIWIGTNTDGVFRYDYSTLKNFTRKHGLPSEVIRSFYQDDRGRLWVATESGVAYFEEAKWIKFQDPEKKLNEGVLSIAQSSDGVFWFGTQGSGLISYDQKSFEYHEKAVVDPYVFSLRTIGDTLYIGTTSEGLHQYAHGVFSKLSHKAINQSWISNIIATQDGIAIISSNGLLKRSNSGVFELITEKNGIASNDLLNGLKDRENNIWLTSSNGITCLRGEQILSFDESSGLTDEKITAIHPLSDGTLAVGTSGKGINILSKSGTVLKTILPPELDNLMVTDLLEVPHKNELWVGVNLAPFGVLVLDLNHNSFVVKRKITSINGVPLKSVTNIELGKNNDIWIGSYTNGLFKITPSGSTVYTKKNGLASNSVYTFTLNHLGQPVISLYQKGVYVLEGDRFISLSKKFSLKEKFVQSIACSPSGIIYLGNKTEGLSVIYPSGKVHHYGTKDGLLSNLIQAICVDRGNVWCGSDQGVNKLILKNGKLVKLQIFNEKSGLINSEVQHNTLQLFDRELWIGASSGLSRMNVDNNHASHFQAKIELQGIKLFFEEVDWKQKKIKSFSKRGIPSQLELSYRDNHLTFMFNAVTTHPVKYSYFLKNSDNKWTPYLEVKEATYSNLAPGSYVFMVKSLDCYGETSEILEIPVVISPPFWATWWFRISAVVIGLLLFFWFVKRRERNFRDRQQKLELIVESRTKEVVEASERAEIQRKLVELKNKEIVDSIEYAKRIQSAMLPTVESLHSGFPESSILYQPKDIVAGDFYWYLEIDGFKFVAVADCTGHGVPGALMSVVCYNALNRAVREYGNRVTGEILDRTRDIILMELAKSDQGMRDGMDISLLMVHETEQIVQWSGANTPLWMVPKNAESLIEIKGDKQPIGLHIFDMKYTTHTIRYETGALFVLFSDGYADQFGGSDGKKFKSPNFKQLIFQHQHLSTLELGERLQSHFMEWKGEHEQVDDVCVLLIRL